MTLVSPDQSAPLDEINASDINNPVNQIAAVVNGNIDDTNISSVSGTKIATGTVPPAAMTTAAQPETRFIDTGFDFVASGCVWSGDSYGSTRAASMTAGVAYISGKRLVIAAVTARTFTASKDTYIDLDTTGTPVYTEVANNAASPALTANYVRIGIIVTGASSIANVGAVNQGQQDKVLPIASSVPYQVTDSLGNLICPRDPNRQLLGYRQIVANVANTSQSPVLVTGLSCPVIVPTGRKVRITAHTYMSASALRNVTVSVWDGTVGSGTQLAGYLWTSAGASYFALQTPSAVVVPSVASKTYNVGVGMDGAATNTINAAATYPSYISVELV